MIKYSMRLALLLGISISMISLSLGEPENGNSSERSTTLTVQETLGAVFMGGGPSTDLHSVYASANPEAKSKLLKLMGNQKILNYHRNIFGMLGYIGTKKDVKVLRKWLKTTLQDGLKKQEYELLSPFFSSLARMSRRGIKPARTLLKKSTTREFWEKHTGSDYEFPEDKTATHYLQGRHVDAILWRALSAYSRSGAEDWKQRIRIFLSNLKSEDLKKTFKKSFLNIERLKKEKKALRHLHYTRADHPPVSKDVRKQLDKMFNNDFKNPGRRKNHDVQDDNKDRQKRSTKEKDTSERNMKFSNLEEVKSKEIRRLLQNGIKAYRKIGSALKKGRRTFVKKRILDDGEPMEQGDFTPASEYQNALSQLKKILKLLDRQKFKPVQFEVKKMVQKTDSSNTKSDSNRDTKRVFIVSFQLKGSEPAQKELMKITNTKTVRTIQNNRLVVFMKRIDGKWYWNPFGW